MDRNRIGKCLVILLAAVCPITLTAQNSVTPIIMPTPAGQLITVNNGPGNHSDPHVSGDLVSYSGRNRGQTGRPPFCEIRECPVCPQICPTTHYVFTKN